MNSMDRWGPWAIGITDAERIARTRALRAIVRLLTGPRGADLDHALARAEDDPDQLELALAALNRLAPLDRRKVLSSYAGLTRPATPARGTAKPARRFLSAPSYSEPHRDPRRSIRVVLRPGVRFVAGWGAGHRYDVPERLARPGAGGRAAGRVASAA